MAPAATAGAGRDLGTRAALGLVVAGIVSVQFGAGFAVKLFDRVGPGGAVLLRLVFAAVMLVAVWRPRAGALTRRELALVGAFGAVLGLMNWSFYEAIDRIPLGVAVTLEFVGPLGVAVAGSRRALDLVWVALAAAGVVLLAGGEGAGVPLDRAGVVLALAAGACWAAYILLSARVGRALRGGTGLALAMVPAALIPLPAAVHQAGAELLAPGVLAVGLAVALASSVVPYSLELEALRHLELRVFGVLMSLEPAIAALSGLVILGQELHARELAAIALVVAASAGATGVSARRSS